MPFPAGSGGASAEPAELDAGAIRIPDAGQAASWALLAVLLAVAAAARFHELASRSLWLDEILQAKAGLLRFDAMMRLTRTDDQAFLMNGVSWFLEHGFGPGDALLRIPSAIAGVLMVAVMFELGRTLHSRRLGLVAAGLAAVLPFAVWYAQEGRPYSLLMLFSALQVLFAVRAARTGAGRDWLGVAVATLLAVYTDYLALLVSAALAVFLAGALVTAARSDPEGRAVRGRWSLACLAIVGAGYLPWLPYLASFLSRQGASDLARFDPGHRPSWHDVVLIGDAFDLTWFVLAMLLAGIVALAWRLRSGGGWPALAAWGLIPLAVLAVKMHGGLALIWPRYLAFLYPLLVLLGALGAVLVADLAGAAARRVRLRPAAAASVLLAVLAVGLAAQALPRLSSSYTAQKDQYRQVIAYVAAHSKGETVVLAAGNPQQFILLQALGYYARRRGSSIHVALDQAPSGRALQWLRSAPRGEVWVALLNGAGDRRLREENFILDSLGFGAPAPSPRVAEIRFDGVTLCRWQGEGTPAAQAVGLLSWVEPFDSSAAAGIKTLRLHTGSVA